MKLSKIDFDKQTGIIKSFNLEGDEVQIDINKMPQTVRDAILGEENLDVDKLS